MEKPKARNGLSGQHIPPSPWDGTATQFFGHASVRVWVKVAPASPRGFLFGPDGQNWKETKGVSETFTPSFDTGTDAGAAFVITGNCWLMLDGTPGDGEFLISAI